MQEIRWKQKRLTFY